MHADLLRQARKLARLDAKKPRQANLRRAVSAAYYSLFHFLVDAACRLAIGSQHDQGAYRHVLARAFSHATMNDACKSFAGGTLKAAAAKGLPPTFSVPLGIQVVASTFCQLQQMRHLADYDLTERFRRSDVLTLIQQVESAITGFQQLPSSNEKKFFLACLWAWRNLAVR